MMVCKEPARYVPAHAVHRRDPAYVVRFVLAHHYMFVLIFVWHLDAG